MNSIIARFPSVETRFSYFFILKTVLMNPFVTYSLGTDLNMKGRAPLTELTKV